VPAGAHGKIGPGGYAIIRKVGKAVGMSNTERDLMAPEILEPLLEYLREGMSFKEAAALVGIGATTIRKWMAAGKKDMAAGRYSKVAEFSDSVTKAMAEAKHLRIQALNNASSNPAFWAAAAWWLERRYPSEFGRQDRVNMNLSGSLNVGQVANIVLDESEKDALRNILGKFGTGQGEDGQGEPFGFEPDSETELFPLS
jgi:predicted DNA-binding protein (UPF0251 family)